MMWRVFCFGTLGLEHPYSCLVGKGRMEKDMESIHELWSEVLQVGYLGDLQGSTTRVLGATRSLDYSSYDLGYRF